MSEPDPFPLAGECAALLRVAAGDRRQAAAKAGARAADAGLELRALVDTMLQVAATHWQATGSDSGSDALALLESVREILASLLDGHAGQARAELDRHGSERLTFINDLFTGRVDPGRLAERANRYGIRLSAAHTVLVGRGSGITPEITRRIDTALAARFGAGNTLTALRDGELVCVSAGGLRGIDAELAHLLLGELGTGCWQVAVGRPHPGLSGLTTSLEEARNALDHAAKLHFTSPLLNAADLLVFPVLLRDREAIVDLVTTVLGPLVTARGGPGSYLDVLSVLFDNQGNYTATARQMHLSVRAVTYRLDRIRDLTGYHPGEPTQRFTLQAAVLGARLLNWPTP
ncbi:PucR family transcriptional regulator [Actinoplanes awajinensis]|uniref:Transcriptional regulator n=1 Tax=Actinoplanes awajinensis subsp. mycoplanecinus TaxID=135947 RepID=A0A101J9S1_9ACTN|nr:helix-turn-helix domain-containing protein [Actinoplanes awajinensis]KUL22831.1 transcriptional regulator [Actinoplanes awajinensis subsp. mycoplanecinus]